MSGGAVSELKDAGHNVKWSGDWPADPGDEEILNQAHLEKRILVTLDKDFGELAVVKGTAHSGIIRLVNCSAHRQASTCAMVLSQYGEQLKKGAIVTAEPSRVRIRPPERGS